MQTKEFTNSFGRPVQLSRDEYINRWISHTTQLFDIFEDAGMGEDFIKVQAATHRAAFKAWEAHS